MPYKEKSRYDEFQRITILAQNAGIPKMIIDDAVIYHKKFLKQKHLEDVIEMVLLQQQYMFLVELIIIQEQQKKLQQCLF